MMLPPWVGKAAHPPNTLPALEEGNVDGRGVEIDKFKDKHLKDESIFIHGLSAMHLCGRETGTNGMRMADYLVPSTSILNNKP